MKYFTLAASLLAYSSIAQALVSLTYIPTEDDKIHIGDSIRVKWTTEETYVRSLLPSLLTALTNTVKKTRISLSN
jgi:hypothetical protein